MQDHQISLRLQARSDYGGASSPRIVLKVKATPLMEGLQKLSTTTFMFFNGLSLGKFNPPDAARTYAIWAKCGALSFGEQEPSFSRIEDVGKLSLAVGKAGLRISAAATAGIGGVILESAGEALFSTLKTIASMLASSNNSKHVLFSEFESTITFCQLAT